MKLQNFSKQWWEQKLDQGFESFLVRLRATEWDAANRFQLTLDSWHADSVSKRIFEGIMLDERRHSKMVEEVLIAQGIQFPPLAAAGRERYWEQVWPHVTSFRFACAALAFGETLAITRFRVIASHPKTPEYVRELVEKLIPDERRHISELTRIAGTPVMNVMRRFHEAGMEALGIR